MNTFKKFLITFITTGILLIGTVVSASAYTGYAGSDSGLIYANGQANHAKIYFTNMGYTTTQYHGSDYTKASVKNVVPSVRAFYVSCHGGGNGSYFCTNKASDNIYSTDLYSWTSGFYKFAFIDACQSGNTQRLYNAFNMKDGDGNSNAFLGWKENAYDNYSYSQFSKAVFEGLYSGKNLNDAVWSARTISGVTNYQIYGDWNMTMN